MYLRSEFLLHKSPRLKHTRSPQRQRARVLPRAVITGVRVLPSCFCANPGPCLLTSFCQLSPGFANLSQKQGPSFLLLHVAAENVGDTSGSNLGAKLVELVMGVTFPVCERFGSIDHGGSYTWLRGMLGQDCGTQKPQKGERCLARVPQAQGMTNHDQPPTALQHELLKPSRRSGRSQRYPWSRHEQTVTHRVAPARR